MIIDIHLPDGDEFLQQAFLCSGLPGREPEQRRILSGREAMRYYLYAGVIRGKNPPTNLRFTSQNKGITTKAYAQADFVPPGGIRLRARHAWG